MKKVICCLAALCLLLSACGPLGEGEYRWESSHPVDSPDSQASSAVMEEQSAQSDLQDPSTCPLCGE